MRTNWVHSASFGQTAMRPVSLYAKSGSSSMDGGQKKSQEVDNSGSPSSLPPKSLDDFFKKYHKMCI